MNFQIASTLILTVGLLLLGWDATRQTRNPLVMLAGLGLLFFAVLARLFSGAGPLAVFTGLLLDAGLGLSMLALFLGLNRRTAAAATALMSGLTLLGAALLITYLARLFGAHAAPGPAAEAFLLELGPDDRIEEVAGLLDAHDARFERAFPSVTLVEDEDLAQVYLVFPPADAADALVAALLRDVENVDHVEANRTVRLPPLEVQNVPSARVPGILANDPMAASQWGLVEARIHAAHALLRDVTPKRKAVVAILDTGVDAAHEDLRGVFRQSPGTVDRNGHGTHCAGIAGAATNNGVGVASLNWEGRFVEIASYPALPFNGTGTFETIAQALIDAAEAGADVLSLSLGDVAPEPPRVVASAVAFALRRGAVVVASAGNADGDAAAHMPSNIEGVIAVAAVDAQLRKATFSNTNTRLSRPIAAPGVGILSLKPGQAYVSLNGTSMATPFVSGLIGVLRALDPALTAEAAYRILLETGRTVPDSDRVGRMIDAERAVRAVLTST